MYLNRLNFSVFHIILVLFFSFSLNLTLSLLSLFPFVLFCFQWRSRSFFQSYFNGLLHYMNSVLRSILHVLETFLQILSWYQIAKVLDPQIFKKHQIFISFSWFRTLGQNRNYQQFLLFHLFSAQVFDLIDYFCW